MFYNKNNKIIGMICLFVIFVTYTSKLLAEDRENDNKIVIIGGGHIGLMEAYSAFERAKRNGQDIRVTIFEKNSYAEQTTAANIWNSHTPDEIVSVVPRGLDMEEALKSRFDQPGGIRIDDVEGINNSECTKRFIEQVKIYGKNEAGHEIRTQSLLGLGKAGMLLWKQFYENADEPLKAILQESNFNPCCEINKHEKPALHKGYRVDLIYGINDAVNRAKSMTQTYQGLGYENCKILSPDDVVQRDPFLAHFCDMHSVGQRAQREWKNDTSAIWRPGGCLDTQTFLPKLIDYLKTAMGTYRGKNGQQKNRFQIKFDKKVMGVVYSKETDDQIRTG
jgi:hypothetical protein